MTATFNFQPWIDKLWLGTYSAVFPLTALERFQYRTHEEIHGHKHSPTVLKADLALRSCHHHNREGPR